MKKYLIFAMFVVLAIALTSPFSVSAKTKAGTKSGSFFYFFDKAFENTSLFFTFNPEKKAKKVLENAEERLAEAEELASENKPEAVKTAMENYKKNIEVLEKVLIKVPEEAKEAIKKAIEASKERQEEEVEETTELEKEISENEMEVEETENELKEEENSEKTETKNDKKDEQSKEIEKLKKEVEALKQKKVVPVPKKSNTDSAEKEDCAIKHEVSDKDSCYRNLARLNNDVNVCNKISSGSGVEVKRSCFSSFPTYKPYKLVSMGIPMIEKNNFGIKSNIRVTIKNEAVLPYITNVAIYNCKATDGINIIPMVVTDGYEFSEKALLPSQEAVIEFNVDTYPEEKCIYNDNGIKMCERPLEKAKRITSCDFSIATDGRNITGGWGEFFQTLVF